MASRVSKRKNRGYLKRNLKFLIVTSAPTKSETQKRREETMHFFQDKLESFCPN